MFLREWAVIAMFAQKTAGAPKRSEAELNLAAPRSLACIPVFGNTVAQVVVLSILLYGCETWPVRVADERMLAGFDNDSIHHILHTRRTLHMCGTAVPPSSH